ncbi:RNA-splicing factor [Malassezia sp. CBS 17886]|nr:RNA-splicing factor [Malassezia sp. CBS 17886]
MRERTFPRERIVFKMGAGDLNMKKSWHPLLHQNQERVWKQEQEALVERKKLDELRKERDQERQMQELHRIHQEAGGKKRAERLEWMYATPAAKSGPSENELEDYLLGKKRVDKLLQGTEAEQLSRTAQPFAETPSASSTRDFATKVREDPLLAIKQQEQAVYDMLMKDPTPTREARLAQMMGDAQKLASEREAHMSRVTAHEKAEALAEDERRTTTHDTSKWKEGGGTGQASFLLDQQRDLWGERSGGMDLHERLRRGRHALERLPHE